MNTAEGFYRALQDALETVEGASVVVAPPDQASGLIPCMITYGGIQVTPYSDFHRRWQVSVYGVPTPEMGGEPQFAANCDAIVAKLREWDGAVMQIDPSRADTPDYKILRIQITETAIF